MMVLKNKVQKKGLYKNNLKSVDDGFHDRLLFYSLIRIFIMVLLSLRRLVQIWLSNKKSTCTHES